MIENKSELEIENDKNKTKQKTKQNKKHDSNSSEAKFKKDGTRLTRPHVVSFGGWLLKGGKFTHVDHRRSNRHVGSIDSLKVI